MLVEPRYSRLNPAMSINTDCDLSGGDNMKIDMYDRSLVEIIKFLPGDSQACVPLLRTREVGDSDNNYVGTNRCFLRNIM